MSEIRQGEDAEESNKAAKSSEVPEEGATSKPENSSSESLVLKARNALRPVLNRVKEFFSVKRNLYISIAAFVTLVVLIVGMSITFSASENARLEALAVQLEQETLVAEEEALQGLIDSTSELIAVSEVRYEDSIAWATEEDRAELFEALEEIRAAVVSPGWAKLDWALIRILRNAYDLVGTQEAATYRAEAAAKAEADAAAAAAAKAQADRLAAETTGQRNARIKALQYLDYSAFSRQGLIGQLEFEGFSSEDATYGADAAGADWNQQAVEKAAQYLDYSAFSRQGLIDQLRFEGFSQAEAEFGVSQNGY